VEGARSADSKEGVPACIAGRQCRRCRDWFRRGARRRPRCGI